MSEFLGTDPHQEISNQDIKSFDTNTDGFDTDVEGIKADGIKQVGFEKFPIFNVTHQEFFNNMASNRKKIRFKNGSKLTDYIKKTRNSNRSFFIRYTDPYGNSYERRVK